MASNYRAQLSAWYNQIMRDYRTCVPQNMNFSLNFSNSQASDWDLYREAMGFYDSIKSNWYSLMHKQQNQEEKPARYHLRAVSHADGSVYFIDMNGHSEADVKLIRRKDGLYDFIGTQQAFERVGGRGIISDIINKLEDNDFFHTRHNYQQQKAA